MGFGTRRAVLFSPVLLYSRSKCQTRLNSQQIFALLMNTSDSLGGTFLQKKDHRQHKRIATFKDGFWDQEGGSSFTLAALLKE